MKLVVKLNKEQIEKIMKYGDVTVEVSKNILRPQDINGVVIIRDDENH